MKFEKKDITGLVLVIVSTAAVFFTAGAFFADFLETTRLDTTVIEYVPATSPPTKATTSATTEPLATTVATTTTVAEATIAKTATSVSAKINLNTATKEELMTVSGIGEVYATRIIAYRDLIGYFTNLEELLEVEGIGEKRLAQWEPFLTV